MLRHEQDVVESQRLRDTRSSSIDPPVPGQPPPWHFLYFLPLPQGQGSLRPTFLPSRRTVCTLARLPPWASLGSARARRRGRGSVGSLKLRLLGEGPGSGHRQLGLADARGLARVPGAGRTAPAAAAPGSSRGRPRRRLGFRRRASDRLVQEDPAQDLLVDPVHEGLEHRERLFLVLDERIALAVAAQADAFLQVVERVAGGPSTARPRSAA